MKKLIWLTSILLLMAGGVESQTTTGFRVTTAVTWSTDSTNYPPDSVIVYYAANALPGMGRIVATYCEPTGYSNIKGGSVMPDTMCAFANITVALLGDVVVNPSAIGYWFLPDSSVVRDNAPQVAMNVWRVDSLVETISATTDTAAIARSVWDNDVVSLATRTVTSSASGTGGTIDSILVLSAVDSTAIGAGVSVWMYPNNGGAALQNLTDANGYAIFSAVVDTYLVYMWQAGFFQTNVPDSSFLLASGDTSFYMTQTTASTPSTPSLTAVDFYFYTALGAPLEEVTLTYELIAQRGSELHHLDSTKSIAPGLQGVALRSDSAGKITIQVIPNDSIIVAPNELGTTRYRIKALDPSSGLSLLGDKGILIEVPASASGLTYPTDF